MEGEPTLQQKIDRIADFTTGGMSFKDKKELVDTFFYSGTSTNSKARLFFLDLLADRLR